MKKAVGLWIDHRRAIIVAVTDKGEEIGLVVSKAEKLRQRSGDSPMKGRYESQKVPADDSRQRTLTGHLNIYYEAVIACLRDAQTILIFGPGEAKGELQKHLKKSKLSGSIVRVETVDKMTDRQIAAKVRQYFDEKPSTIGSRRNYLTRSSSGGGRPRR
jgi:stalled ribosome rescue protein Dom34